ncbi:MAG TPA: 2'-deoxycytidine 5'-triphosphate deaminase [Candidatus Acidoferrum sp.]|nr:2'-deoxycytidine 5'-triphosphate deaminase [Candidatus Acidoferrum sp.]HXY79654.1 2'-deoxycytidine 5'-triphosphate deaminase [Candidatus Bathyarchaeia archaeon]
MGTTKGVEAPALIPDVRRDPRRTGILPSQEIWELINNQKILSFKAVEEAQVQPASIDLRLGNVAYRVQASFLPGRASTIKSKINDLKLAELDLTKPTLLERGAVFVIPVIEQLALPFDIGGAANPKSTTGRLDIFTRLVTEGGNEFEEQELQFEQVPKGYKGELYVEVVSRTFPVILQAGAKLTQLRFVRGKPPAATDNALERFEQTEGLVYYENGEAPAKAILRGGLRMSIDLQGSGGSSVVAYKAKRNCPAVDLSKAGAHDAAQFWDAITAPASKRLVLDPGDFYILASRERISVPSNWAAEMTQFDPSIGEFSVHYAGFFDPGFGYGTSGEIKGTKAVLEVRAHEVPILLEDRQVVGRLMYHKMASIPDKLYGQAIGSSYQQQGLALSKQFRVAPLKVEGAATQR